MKVEFLIEGSEPEPYFGIFNGYVQEAINQVTLIELFAAAEYMLSEEDLEEMIGKTATIKLSEQIDGELKVNRYDGLIYELHQPNPYLVEKNKYIYKFVIRPAVWKLNIGSNARSFLNKSRIEVIDEVLTEYNLNDGQHFEKEYFKESTYPKLSQILQCEVSDWIFIQQLMQEAGINFSFHSDKDGSSEEKIRLVDSNLFFPKPYSKEIKWNPSANMVAERHVESFETRVRAVPSSVEATATFGDGKTSEFQSTVSLEKGKGSAFRVFSAEGQEESVATNSAKVVSDGFEANRVIYEGKSNHFLIRSGERVDINCPFLAMTKKILVKSVKHFFEQNVDHALGGQKDVTYTNEFTAAKDKAEIRPSRYMRTISADLGSQNPFSALASKINSGMGNDSAPYTHRQFDQDVITSIEQLTKSANTFGIMLGLVVEDAKVSSGQEMTCKISNERFPDGLIAKVSIAWLVPGGGGSALPRAGMQVYFVIVQGQGGQNEAVILSYRPSSGVAGQDPSKSKAIKTVVPGSTPDEAVKVAEISPSNRQRVGMTGEGGTAEVTLLDGDGSVSIHATADILLVSDANTSMSSADHQHMSGSVSEQFASVNRIVSGDQTEQIGGNHDMTVTGNQTLKIDGNEEKTIGGSRTIEVTGGVTDNIDGNESKTVKGPRVVKMKAGHVETITGAQSTTIKGARSLSVKAASTEKIKGDSSEAIKGKKTITAKKDIAIGTDAKLGLAVKKDATVKVDGKMTFDVKKKVLIKCGACKISVEKNGKVVIKGKKFDFKASGKIKMKGSKINLN